jgi:hypothetical protein
MTSSFAVYRARVVTMSLEGAPTTGIEAMLQRAPLATDIRDALWLLGWSLNERRDRARGKLANLAWA